MTYHFDVFVNYEPYRYAFGNPPIIEFYDLNYKKSFQTSDIKLVRDVTQKSQSEIIVYDENDSFESGDIIFGTLFSEYFGYLNLGGTIVEISKSDDENFITTIKINFGIDMANYLKSSYNETTIDMSDYSTKELFKHAISFQNIMLESKLPNQIALSSQSKISGEKPFQQMFKKLNIIENHKIEKRFRSSGNLIPGSETRCVVVELLPDPNQTPFKINLNDGIYSKVDIKISEASVNSLLVNYQNVEDGDYIPAINAYYDKNKVTTNIVLASSQPIQTMADIPLRIPVIQESMDIQFDASVPDFEKITEDYFKGKEYSNEIKFEIPFNILSGKNFGAWKFDNSFLGRKLEITLPNFNKVESLISKYEIDSELNVKIICGLSRSDLISLLKIGKGV